ncbi:endonuclease [Zhengella mangrovi]|uniref:Endonuclease n=2 Tax=Zhengella mangrovi TaxID=1982044 RepID=A0A2G1QRW3_9HYPH|nr:endonuclease [Zhengella mangrovi]
MKLKAMPPAQRILPASRLDHVPGDDRAREARRRIMSPWRAWYSTERWQRLRDLVFARDGYVCQQTGTLCSGTGNDWNAPVADHKIRHDGDPDLFWDLDNLQTVTKRWHDTTKQRIERAERDGRGG